MVMIEFQYNVISDFYKFSDNSEKFLFSFKKATEKNLFKLVTNIHFS